MPPKLCAFLDQQDRHLGPQPGHRERGQAAGKAAARDQQQSFPPPSSTSCRAATREARSAPPRKAASLTGQVPANEAHDGFHPLCFDRRHDRDRRRALSRGERRLRLADAARARPGLYARPGRADPARDRLVACSAPSSTARRRAWSPGAGRRAAGPGSTPIVHAYPLWWLPLSVLRLSARCTTPGSTGRTAGCTGRRCSALAHAVHHASRPPTAWAAMSFSPAGGADRRDRHSRCWCS